MAWRFVSTTQHDWVLEFDDRLAQGLRPLSHVASSTKVSLASHTLEILPAVGSSRRHRPAGEHGSVHGE